MLDDVELKKILILRMIETDNELVADPAEVEKILSRIKHLHFCPYGEFLSSPEWFSTRKLVIDYAGDRCQLCNSSSRPLNVHHRTYSLRGLEMVSLESFNNVIALCVQCHNWFHEYWEYSKDKSMFVPRA